MKSYKKAFTLTEILVVMGIVGFILVVQLVVLIGKVNQYGASYYTAYSAVKKTAYNILADIYCPDCYTIEGRTPQCGNNPKCPDFARSFPENKTELCTRFAEFVNVAETNCNANYIGDTTAINRNTTAHIISSNGFKIYFSDLHKHAATNTDFFITYIDLNGSNEPNRITCNNTEILPDIVPFAITKRGEAIPMGLPKYSKTYLTATIKYPEDGENYKSEGKETKMLSFYEAVLGAWAKKNDKTSVFETENIPFSIDFDSATAANSTIKNCSSVYASLKNEAKDVVSSLDEKTKHCKEGTFNCRVVINKYTTSRY